MQTIDDLEELIREEEQRLDVKNIKVLEYEDALRQKSVVKLVKRLNNTKYGVEKSITIRDDSGVNIFRHMVESGVREMRDFEYKEFGKSVEIDGRDITVVLETEMFKARCNECYYGKVYNRPNYAHVALTGDGSVITSIEEKRKATLFMALVSQIAHNCHCHRKTKDLYTNSAIVK